MHPFTDNPPESIAELGEHALLGKFRQWLGDVSPPSPHGMGDDTAVLPPGANHFNLITTDTLVYQSHFNDKASPQQAGGKLLKRNISDIAAMGGTPHSAVIGLFLPPNLRLDWLRDFYRGIRDEAIKYNVNIVGGDLCETDGFLGSQLTLLGAAARPLKRDDAEKGDFIYVSGSLGGSSLGKHLDFTPRLVEGRWLADQTIVHSMIDVTDGLMKDLPALIQPGCAAGLQIDSLPISEAALQLSAISALSPQQHALSDGEDFELLFTVSEKIDPEQFIKEWHEHFDLPLTHIGQMIDDSKHNGLPRIINLTTGEACISPSGYEHFKKT